MALQSQDNVIPTGQLKPGADWGLFNNITFLVQQMLTKVQTVALVNVVAVSNAGELSPVGTVDVQPMVSQIDAFGIPTPHAPIFSVPYFRLQGGVNAIIIDPVVGDIGICLVCNRDISKVKATKRASVPGSNRTFSFSDGLYLGGVLNGVPNQYVSFGSAGVEIVSPGTVSVTAPNIALNGSLTNNGVNIGSTHHHGGVATGSGVTSGPS